MKRIWSMVALLCSLLFFTSITSVYAINNSAVATYIYKGQTTVYGTESQERWYDQGETIQIKVAPSSDSYNSM